MSHSFLFGKSMLIHLHNRTVNTAHIEEIFWAHGGGVQPGLIGCHIYFVSGRELDLSRVEANVLFDQLRLMIETEKLAAINKR